jgi:Beta-lactamase superfamily domain
MSLTVKHLNSDACFLLTFQPISSFPPSPGQSSQAFTILLDPWLSGPSKIFHSKFSISRHKNQACISSLCELPEPDIVIISQDKSDHCHKETLTKLPQSGGKTIILAEPAAAKVIKGWKHFDKTKLITLSKWEKANSKGPMLYRVPGMNPAPEGEIRRNNNLSAYASIHSSSQNSENSKSKASSIYRVVLPAATPNISPGEVTIAFIPQKGDITRLHNAICITYRPPASFDYHPDTPPDTPTSPRSTSTFDTSSSNRTLSIIYSPHGCTYKTLEPYITSHLVREAALPLTALLHCFDKVQNAWYLGGNVCTGFPGGLEIAQNLGARAWISAHDGDKDIKGLATKKIVVEKFEREEVESVISPRSEKFPHRRIGTEAVVLQPGEEIRLSNAMDFGLDEDDNIGGIHERFTNLAAV